MYNLILLQSFNKYLTVMFNCNKYNYVTNIG